MRMPVDSQAASREGGSKLLRGLKPTAATGASLRDQDNGGGGGTKNEESRREAAFGVTEAEGTGLEPATPYGAPHFQCGR